MNIDLLKGPVPAVLVASLRLSTLSFESYSHKYCVHINVYQASYFVGLIIIGEIT